ncbi:MAG: transporter, partial [Fusobacteriales bacterium]|nr:transporter [Fusobacteriales bacterium]
MKRNKKLLLSFLSLNAMLASYTAEASASSAAKYERVYNSVVKNIQKDTSNEKTYQLLERILNQKNKELKDLYSQGDYVVKPEYLEWQVFFTGFYDEYNEGMDNSKENAQYHSKVTGYYDVNGNYIVTSGTLGGLSGKPYMPLQQPKEINLGVSIPIKGMTREPLNLLLTSVGEINVNPNTLNVVPPSGLIMPSVNVIEFQPLAPNLIAPTPITVSPLSLSFGGSGNGDSTWFGSSGNAPISQQSMSGSGGTGTFETIFTGGNGIQQYIDKTDMQGYAGGHTNPSGAAHTENNYRFNGSASFGSMLLVGGEYIPVHNMELINLRTSTAGNLALFHTDSHNDHGSSIWDLDNTNVTLKGDKAILFDVQYHGGNGDSGLVFNNGILTADNSISYTSIYDGTTHTYTPQNRYVFVTIAASGTTSRYLYLKNEVNGEMYLNGLKDTLSNFAAEDNTNYGGAYFENRGIIELNGVKSMGAVFAREYSRSWIRFENALNLNGDGSVGAVFEYNFNTNATNGAGGPGSGGVTFEKTPVKDSVFNIKIGEKANPSNADSNDTSIIGNSTALVEEATALYFNNGSGTMKDYKILHAQLDALEYSRKATLVSIAKGKVILDGTDTGNRLKIDGGASKTGIDNMAIYAGAIGALPGSTVSEIESYIPITITNSDLSTAIFGEKRGKITNNGDIVISGSNGVKGIITDSYAQATFGGNITLTNGSVYTDVANKKTGSVVIGAMNHSSVTGTGVITADVSGKESIALYADNNSTIDIQNTASSIKVSDGAFALTATNNGTIKYGGNNIEAGQKSLLFYLDNTSNIEIVNSGTNAKITGAANATDRGTAFYYKSPTAYGTFNSTDISTYFTNRYNTTLTNLTLNMEEGSRLFIVDNVAMNLTSTAMSMSGLTNAPTINMLGSSFKTFMLYQSDLTIDQAINLDSSTDDYNNLEIVTSKITNNGFQITGTGNGQTAMAQENGLDMMGIPLARNIVTLTNNNGTISLNGLSSVGIYANNGEIYNNGTGKINMSGDGSIGIYAVNGAKVDTAAGTEINIGKNGVGIFAEGWKQGTAQAFGNGELDIKNSGLIKSGTGTNAIGVYLNNNSGAAITNSKLDLSTGTIDVSDSENGIGIYINEGTVIDSGSTITVGKNGIGLYAKDSDIAFNGATINLNGDNAIGLYLDGTTSLNTTGTNTININGKNVVLFNMASSGTVNNNFTVGTTAPGSSYSLGNIVNGAFNYTGTSELSSNGVLVSGERSSIFLNGSAITVNPGSMNVAAIALDGQAGSFVAGMSANTDGENTGTITLENSSIGLYGKNNARLRNTGGTITAGDQSAGIMTSGTGSTAVNTGTITIGSGSQGITLKDGTDILNGTGAGIFSSGINSVGIYADNVTASVTNDGTIQLLGDKSIGIYSKGTSIKTINNTGLIEIGTSNSINDPSIGIFTENPGDTIVNTNTIKSGVNSIGIYSAGGTINQNGISDVGNSGVGIYSTNGTVNIGGTSIFNFGTNNAVGVYAINSAVTSNATMNIGDNNYGFILTNGTFTGGTSNVTMGRDSVYVYRAGLGTITNSSTITMNGSNNIGFYTVDSGEIVNNANITGTAGNNNVGIYNTGGKIDNTGTIAVGASDLIILTDSDGVQSVDVQNSKYAVGIYGENSVINNHPSGNISIGYGSIGIVAKKGSAANDGVITGTGDRAMGMYSEGAVITNNGSITLTGNDVIGMAGNGKGSVLINSLTGIINVNGQNAIGMFGNLGAEIINDGTIIADGPGAMGIVLSQGSSLENSVSGKMIINSITSGNSYSTIGTTYPTPSIINSGVIKVSEKFETDGINVIIKVDPSTVTVPTASEVTTGGYDPIAGGAEYLISNAVSIEAPLFNITNPLQITGNFTEGTNVEKYKLEDVIIPGSGSAIDAGKVPVVSKLLTWRVTPVVNSSGNVDFWMEKIDYDEFTDNLWYEDFGRALDVKYFNAQGDALKIFDKIDVIETESEFRHVMGSLAGNVYANINQREDDIAKTFENTLHLLQDSSNNTK